MNKVLILTAATGQGHNQVARVLELELQAREYTVEVLDVFGQGSPFLRMAVNDTYNRMAASSSHLNGLIYRTSQQEMINKGLTRLSCRLLKKPVMAALDGAKADLIIATHPILVGVLGELRLRNLLLEPIISIVTDFDAHRFYVNQQVDAYITACAETGDILHRMGVAKDKIFIHGIPVKRSFGSKHPRAADTAFTILLMGGSLGVKSLKKVLRILVKTHLPLRVVVVCGSNKKLKKELEIRYAKNTPDNVELLIYGYTNQISELMDEADVLFSKPGGITSSEAIRKRVPMAIPFLIPGVEEINARILQDLGVAIKIKNLKAIPKLVEKFYTDPSILEEMANNMQVFAGNYSIDDTISLCEEMINRQSFLSIGRNCTAVSTHRCGELEASL